MSKTLIITLLMATAGVLAVAGAIAIGGPGPIEPLASINDPFAKADFSDVPAPRFYTARDGTKLAWLHYPAQNAAPSPRRIVLVHGSSGRASSMHVLARALAGAGFQVASLDMRGHGDSAPRGHIGYIGQLEDDVADFMQAVPHGSTSTLAGFSSGGGFVLRFAGSDRQDLFDRYLLLAPYLHHRAPTNRTGNGNWVSIGLPRLVALSLLDRLGITAWNHLPVLRFGLNDYGREFLTSSYSYALAANFRPNDDYLANIGAASRPMQIVAGTDDTLFDTSRYAGVFADAGRPVRVTLVEGIDHIGLTLEPRAMQAIVAACHN